MTSATAVALVIGLGPALAASAPGWRTVTTLSKPSLLVSVTAPDQRHAWAVGYGATGTKLVPVVERWNGSTWASATLPPKVVSALGRTPLLVTAAATRPSNLWAFSFGETSPTGALVHWLAERWHTVASLPAQLRNSSLASVLARSDTDVWVGGAVKNSKHGTSQAVGHWNGHGWTVVKLKTVSSSGQFSVVSMVPDGSGGIWGDGTCPVACPSNRPVSLLWHEVAGRWTGPVSPKLSRQPFALADLSAVGHSVWAVGGIGLGASANPKGLMALWGPVPH